MSTLMKIVRQHIDEWLAKVQTADPALPLSEVREVVLRALPRMGLSRAFWRGHVMVAQGFALFPFAPERPRCVSCSALADVLCDQLIQGAQTRVCYRPCCRLHAAIVGDDQHRCRWCVGGDRVLVAGDGQVHCDFCRDRPGGCAACFNARLKQSQSVSFDP